MGNREAPLFTKQGAIITVLLLVIVGLLGFAIRNREGASPAPLVPGPSVNASAGTAAAPASRSDGGFVKTALALPLLPPAGTYVPRDSTLEIEMSQYPGYAGLIVANGGLEPNETSPLFQKHGIKLRLKVSEALAWGRLASGALAAWPATVDSLALYGAQAGALVPVLFGFSRGADGIVVKSELRRFNELRGRTLISSQFTVSEFLARFLATETGLGVKLLPDPGAAPDPDKVNLLFAADAQKAGEVFLRELQAGSDRLSGCVTWAPYTDEVVQKSGAKASVLATTSNLLIVADVLLVNKGFAEQNPKMVAALVDAILDGNRRIREHPDAHVETIAKAFGWKSAEVPTQLARVHLANLPENLAFFSGEIDAAGSFGGIYQSAVLAYGRELIPSPMSEDKLLDLRHLKALDQAGDYKDEKILIAPVRNRSSQALEGNPLLSKDIRFHFEANSSKLDLSGEDKTANEANLAAIKKLLQISPGSTVLLRGHVDDVRVPEFKQLGGDALVQKMALAAMQLSKERAQDIRDHLVKDLHVEPKQIDVYGAGWTEPVSKTNPELNRRVEVHWFTLE